MKMLFRPLVASEVEFTVKVEEETDIPVNGNAMASGDEVYDKSVEDEIIARLHRGDSFAWCCIIVEARWEEYVAFASLGCCTLKDESEVAAMVSDYGMKEDAIDELNMRLQSILDRLSKRVIAGEGVIECHTH